ncbi:hypothetical protein NMY22_g14109 [Coprinellus aureogranulatus]|nr:hypothetical protein NMY22_g14109 [Coprinellus aureogranulatus]
MALSEDQVAALAAAVAAWRQQEYFSSEQMNIGEVVVLPLNRNPLVSFIAFYVYYLLTTLDEEAEIIFPQIRSGGVALFAFIRYGTCVFIALTLPSARFPSARAAGYLTAYLGNYRNYYTISPEDCKGLLVAYGVVSRLVSLACNIALGLCLGALLRAGKLWLIVIMIIAAAPTVINGLIFTVIGSIQLPAEPPSPLDRELGYPCAIPPNEEWLTGTIAGVGRSARIYLSFATTVCLLLLAIVTLVLRYRGQNGRLVQIIRRDGGLYYIALAAIRLVNTIVTTPALYPSTEQGDGNPAVVLASVANDLIIPVLAQRLMINMRKVDYMGSTPIASRLLFASAPRLADDDPNGEATESHELDSGESIHPTGADKEHESKVYHTTKMA